MQTYGKWLIALTIAALLLPAPLLAAEGGATLSGSVEAGVAGTAVSDDATRVNEYSTQRPEPGVDGAGKFDLDLHDSRGLVLEGRGEVMSGRDQQYDVDLDVKRVLRNSFRYQTFEHQLDNDRIDYLDGATIRSGASSNPATPIDSTSGNSLPAYVLIDDDQNLVAGGSTYNPSGGLANPDNNSFSGYDADADLENGFQLPEGWRVQQTGGAMMKGENPLADEMFRVTYREWENTTEFVHPALPNLVFDLNYRHQEREGTEQSIGMSKCSSCHITGSSREVDETTEDVTAGVTGKFGLLTLRYQFTDRQFDDANNDPSRLYDPALKPGSTFDTRPFDNRLTYDYLDGELPYDVTPDSEKQSHQVKARVDLSRGTTFVANYINTEIESDKFDEPGIFTLGDKTLQTSYDIYGFKAKTDLMRNLKLTAFLRAEELENDDPVITFEPIRDFANAGVGLADPDSLVRERESVIDREVLTAGADVVWRIARRTTARLGYEYEEEDRDNEHYGTTETNTVKASLNMRPVKGVNGRVSYTYQDIDHPFLHEGAADVPLTDNPTKSPGGVPAILVGTGSLYGTAFYDAREAELTNQPDEVHEGKLSATWAPSARFAATATLRYKDEQADLNRYTWDQTTLTPGLSLWYAAGERATFTFAYNYFDQRSETAFCQGYYDG